MAKHKHTEVICAWTEDQRKMVQYRSVDSHEWLDVSNPTWYPDCEYRIKPESAYPESKMNFGEFLSIHGAYNIKEIANAAIKHALDAGQVEVVLPRNLVVDRVKPEIDNAYAQGRHDGNADRDARDIEIAEAIFGATLNHINGGRRTELKLGEIIATVK